MFGSQAKRYRAAGYLGTIPLPPGAKHPPVPGFTGTHADYPSDDQVSYWIETSPDNNIGIRLGPDVVGLDIDHGYSDKHGLDTIAAAEEVWGPLPKTYLSTARPGGSGIRFFRIPDGLTFPGKVEINGASHVEVIQKCHRYAVVAPSRHPNGNTYQWYDPTGEPCDIPNVSDLAKLPESWIAGLQSSGRIFGQGGPKRELTKDDALAELLKMNDALGDPCKIIKERLAEAIERLGQPGARHDAALLDSMGLISFGHHGHTGVVTALEELQTAFTALVSADRAGSEAEYDRMIHGALARLEGDVAKEDPCAAEDERFLKDVEDKVYRMKVNESARIQFNNDLAGEMQLPELEHAAELALAVPEAPDWLVEGLIPRTGVITLSAAKKVGKTTLTMKLIKAILDEEMFLDTFQAHKPAGSVCIYDLELPRDKLGQWIRRNGIAKHNVYATSLRGRVSHFNVMNEVHRRIIADDLKAKNCACLVVDPLGPYLRMTGAEENSASETGRALDALIALKEEAGVDTLILPLHTGHNDVKRARGSSVLADVPDVLISLYKKSDDDEVRHFSATGRDVDIDSLSFTYDLETGEITMLEGGTPDEARENDVIAVLDLLESVSGISQNRIVEGLKTRIHGCGRTRARTALAQAIKSGYVRSERTADGPKAPINHFLTDHGEGELAQVRRVMGEAA